MILHQQTQNKQSTYIFMQQTIFSTQFNGVLYIHSHQGIKTITTYF